MRAIYSVLFLTCQSVPRLLYVLKKIRDNKRIPNL